MDNRPIAIFDSGIGGLTAVREIEKILPGESIVYFGDTARVPYGTRSADAVKQYAREDINFLMKFGPKAIMSACGTVSSVALDEIKSEYQVDMLGVVESASKTATEMTKNGKIGVISTGATYKSGAFANKIKQFGDFEVFSKACPLFIPLVENGYIERDNEVTKLVAKDYLEPLLNEGIDTLILGCTHFPVIADLIGDVAKDVTLIDSGREAAKSLKKIIEEKNMTSDGKSVTRKYYVSDTPDGFSRVAAMFLGHSLDGSIEKTEI